MALLMNKRRLLSTAFNMVTVAALSTQCVAPERMLLSDNMKASNLQTATMFPINVVDTSTITEKEAIASSDMIKNHLGENGALCYVVRRPGCAFCREEGQTLANLSADLDGFELFGVIKETGVDDEGLAEFNKDFYPFPLYRDADLKFYEALGNNKLISRIPWNPFRIVKGFFFVREASNRVGEKNISGNLIGEGFTKGGVIIFGKDGKQKYAYLEGSLEEIPTEDIIAAAAAVKAEQQ